MTREELLKYGKEYLRDLSTACCEIDELHLSFVRESIKALEQEPCNTDTRIEQIRAKVESINPWALAFASSEYKDTRPQIVARVKSHILEIIDKYKEDA